MAEQQIKDWLTESYDYERPKRGQVREGIILKVEDRGVTVDVGLKRDGIVPDSDLERLGKKAVSELEVGQEVMTYVLRPEDRDGNLILSLYQARLQQDWKKAQEMSKEDKVWEGQVIGCNRGGVVVRFERLRGFVPGSHLWGLNTHKLSPEKRIEKFKEYVGETLPLIFIEVDRNKRRLVLSERLARRRLRKRQRQELLERLAEGQVCKGTVSRLVDFGAFVDLGGADGLIHISEMAWWRVQHPSQILEVGQEIDVHVLRLDHKRNRIGLSLKRLEPNPWDVVDLIYTEGQLASGVVTNVLDFGAFVVLDTGVEGLVHVSELGDPTPKDPKMVVNPGEELVLRILSIQPSRRRIGLSLKRVAEWEKEQFLAQQSAEKEATKAVEEKNAEEATESQEASAKIEEAEIKPESENMDESGSKTMVKDEPETMAETEPESQETGENKETPAVWEKETTGAALEKSVEQGVLEKTTL